MNRVVVVTGASAGIGEQIAVELGRRGDSLVLAARTADALERVAGTVATRPHIVTADVTYSPSMIADAMNLTADSRVKGSAMPATTIIPSILITRENAAQYHFPDSPF